MSSDEQEVGTPDLWPHTGSESSGSKVVLGYLLGGRSSAERVEFLAELDIPEESTADGPLPRVYRNYTRRLREE